MGERRCGLKTGGGIESGTAGGGTTLGIVVDPGGGVILTLVGSAVLSRE